jgi:hypothetical protein
MVVPESHLFVLIAQVIESLPRLFKPLENLTGVDTQRLPEGVVNDFRRNGGLFQSVSNVFLPAFTSSRFFDLSPSSVAGAVDID